MGLLLIHINKMFLLTKQSTCINHFTGNIYISKVTLSDLLYNYIKQKTEFMHKVGLKKYYRAQEERKAKTKYMCLTK